MFLKIFHILQQIFRLLHQAQTHVSLQGCVDVPSTSCPTKPPHTGRDDSLTPPVIGFPAPLHIWAAGSLDIVQHHHTNTPLQISRFFYFYDFIELVLWYKHYVFLLGISYNTKRWAYMITKQQKVQKSHKRGANNLQTTPYW